MKQLMESRNISRRQFMAPAGCAAGMAALSARGIATGWAANISKHDINTITSQESITDVLFL